MKNKLFAVLAVTLLSTLDHPLSTAHAQGTAFTYLGRLNDGGNPASGIYDVRFTLYDALTGGSAIAAPLTHSPTAVSNGLFTVTLDFGNAFPGAARWLEIAVRTNGGGAFSTLSPRQALLATPYAIYSANAGSAASATTAGSANSVAAANIAGTVGLAQLPPSVVTNGASVVNFAGTFSGNGLGLTNGNIARLTSGALTWGNFALVSSPGVGNGPSLVTAADVNEDGKVDLISANGGANTLSVLTNNGSGGFVPASSPAVGSTPLSVAAADVNEDGKLDLISANEGASTLSVLTNNGSGGFALASSPAVGSEPFSVTTADVNGDGKVDLISANIHGNTLTVLTNNGSGDFEPASSPAVGSTPVSVAAADVNGDGKVDLISANFTVNTLTVLTNNGSGGFVVASTPTVGNGPYSVVAADVNGDGKADLINANYHSDTLSVLTNNGSGGFVLASSAGVGNSPQSVTSADVNGDGKVDLISANADADTLSVLTNNGSGGFVLASTPAVGSRPASVVAVDVNTDGMADLICANHGASTLTVLLNTPTFTGNFIGNGAGLTGLNGANLQDGSVTAAKIGGTLGASQIPDLDASKLTTGTLADARLSANIALRSGGNTLVGDQFINGALNVTNGNVGIGTTTPGYTLEVNGTAHRVDNSANWTVASDRRYKRDITPLTNSLAVLEQLRPSRFRYNEDYVRAHPATPDKERVGFVAQEFEQVFPDYVTRSADGYLSVDISPVTFHNTEAIRELNQKLTQELKRRDVENAALKARVEKLERLLEHKLNGDVK